MNVLSLFDGMSCGRIALERAGVHVDTYYRSEIDKYATQIAEKNYPDSISLGDVKDIDASMFPDGIDLLIGGSPCQAFSNAGNRKGFDDERGQLFWEYVRLLQTLKPKYFLLENVRMKPEHEAVITEALGVEPMRFNSALVSAQNRNRLYWTNIPFMGDMSDRGIVLADVLETEPDNVTLMSDKFTTRNSAAGCLVDRMKPKSRTLSATEYVKNGKQGDYIRCDSTGKPSLCHQVGMASDIKGHDLLRRVYAAEGKSPTLNACSGGHREPKVAISNTRYRKLTPTECERLQTVPEGYTEGVSNTQRYKMLGNGWTVDVIVELLRGVKQC